MEEGSLTLDLVGKPQIVCVERRHEGRHDAVEAGRGGGAGTPVVLADKGDLTSHPGDGGGGSVG